MASVELKNIVKAFGTNVAINHVNLKIEDGEFLVLLGPSGCGKTTTLRSIAGLEHPEEGDILIDGKRVNDLRPADRDMAFCFQQYALYPHLNAFENIAFPLRTQGTPETEIKERVNAVSEVLHITNIYRQKPKHLSSGDQQRVALARAMVRRPKVYLMDEPLSNLDAKLRENMRIELHRMQIESKVTTIYVTHDQVEAMAMADRIAIMNKGYLLQVGTPEEVYSFPANLFVANFIGSPSMNFIPAVYEASSFSTVIDFGEEKYRYPLPADIKQKMAAVKDGEKLVIGVRPEDVIVQPNGQQGQMSFHLKLIENLGVENIFRLERGDVRITARTAPDVVFPEGSKLSTSFEIAGMRLFSRETEKVLA